MFDGINFDCPFGLAVYPHNIYYILLTELDPSLETVKLTWNVQQVRIHSVASTLSYLRMGADTVTEALCSVSDS